MSDSGTSGHDSETESGCYDFCLFQPELVPSFLPGDEVFVLLKSDKETGRACILQIPHGTTHGKTSVASQTPASHNPDAPFPPPIPSPGQDSEQGSFSEFSPLLSSNPQPNSPASQPPPPPPSNPPRAGPSSPHTPCERHPPTLCGGPGTGSGASEGTGAHLAAAPHRPLLSSSTECTPSAEPAVTAAAGGSNNDAAASVAGAGAAAAVAVALADDGGGGRGAGGGAAVADSSGAAASDGGGVREGDGGGSVGVAVGGGGQGADGGGSGGGGGGDGGGGGGGGGSDPWRNRYKVRYHDSGLTYHVRSCRLTRVFPSHRSLVIVCGKTVDYRRLARSQVSLGDSD